MSSPPEPTPDEIRLGELVDQFQAAHAADASVGVGSMRDDAGKLFPELVDIVECLGILHAGVGESSDSIPSQIGPYQVDGLLGSGVSATVYRARAEGGQPVALKLMRESLALSEDSVKRFQREIDVAAALDHPHIVRVLDHGQVNGRLYLAMERVDGSSMADLIEKIRATGDAAPRQRWNAVLDAHNVPRAGGKTEAERYGRRIAALFAPVAKALAHATSKGLIHRDLKPANLLLHGDGRLLVSDFGLAKVIGEEITSTIAVLGTPAFMSPEQASGQSRDVDARSDVYGLGASLYQTLTLGFPVEGDSFPELVAAILSIKPGSITTFEPAYPRGLAKAVSRCLEKEAIDRYQDGDALAADLARIAAGRAARGATVSVKRRTTRFLARHRKPIWFLASVASLLIAFGVWWFTRSAAVILQVWPEARIVLNDQVVGERSVWHGEVARGTHALRVTRDGFRPHQTTFEVGPGGEFRSSISLIPKDPFDRASLTLLAKAYEVEPVPDDLSARRGSEPLPEPAAPAIGTSLGVFPDDQKGLPHVRILTVSTLLKEGKLTEAYAQAWALQKEFPNKPLPYRLAHTVLARMGGVEPARPDTVDEPRKTGSAADGTPRTRALLVGCTEYPGLEHHPNYEQWIRLQGGANDVALIRQTLIDTLGAKAEDIVSLVGRTDPTRARILRELEHLAEKARKGDRVVILMAGHGSQQPDASGDEPDGLDEIFLPVDVKGWDGSRGRVENAITDDELGASIAAIRDAGALVWLLMDCCHAGTMVRGSSERVRRVHPAVLGVPAVRARGGAVEPAPLENLTGIVAMYAAPSYRTAPEMRLPRMGKDRKWHGVFSFLLAARLRRAGGDITFRQLHAQLVAAYQALPYYGTVPVAEGELDLTVAGKRSGRPPLWVRQEGDELILNAGRLAGIEVGTRLDVKGHGEIEVTRAEMLRAFCKGKVPEGEVFAADVVAMPSGDFRLKVAGEVPDDPRFLRTGREDADWIAKDGVLQPARTAAPIQFAYEPANLREELARLFRVENLKRFAASGKLGALPKGLRVEMQKDRKLVSAGQALVPGDRVEIVIQNGTGAAWDLTVFFVSAHQGLAEVYPRERAPRLEAVDTKEIRLGPYRVKDDTQGLEHLLVLAVPGTSREPAWLGWLAQPKLTQRSGAHSELLAALAYGERTRGLTTDPAALTASLLSWRVGWGDVAPPKLSGDAALCVGARHCAELLARDGQSTWEPVRSRGLPDIYRRRAPAVAVIRTASGHGTGFLVAPDLVLTNHHVVADGFRYGKNGRHVVDLFWGDPEEDGWMRARKEPVQATVVLTDRSKDMALLQLPSPVRIEPIPLAARGPGPGAACSLIGHPSAGMLWTLREGRVAQVGRMPHDMAERIVRLLGVKQAAVQLDRLAAVKVILSQSAANPGDSGSPLLDTSGALLGITYAIPRDVRTDKFVYHVHVDEIRAFLKRKHEQGPAVPDAWLLGPRVARSDEFLAAGRQVLIDLDGDAPAGDPRSLVEDRSFDAEAAVHILPGRRIAFYDVANEGRFTLILVDNDSDPEADVRFRLVDGKWHFDADVAVHWLSSEYFKDAATKKQALESFAKLKVR